MTPIDEYHFQCMECGLMDNHKMSCSSRYEDLDKMTILEIAQMVEDETDVVDEDWLSGVSCNPAAPEECESCQ